MNTNAKTETDPAAYFASATQWETTRVRQIEKTARTAWSVAAVAVVVALLLGIAIVIMMPLKQTEPYVVRVDNSIGVPDIVTRVRDVEITGEDAMVKYWLAKYVRHRETYNWYTLQTDYDAVALLSSDEVGEGYAALFAGENPLDKEYRDRVTAEVDIISVVPTSDSTGTVRFSKTTKHRNQDPTTKRFVATIAFDFRAAGRMSESDRMVNPFGFTVEAYRVDSEMAGGA